MKRRLLKLGVFLLLGAIVNVAVAWGCMVAWNGEWYGSPSTLISEDDRASMRANAPASFIYAQKTASSRWLGFGLRVDSLVGIDDEWVDVQAQIFRSGFPWYAVTAEHWVVYQDGWNTDPAGVVNAISVDGYRYVDECYFGGGRWVPVQILLPLLPIWPGFAINTLLYAAFLWLMWIAPGAIRRYRTTRRRMREHRCLACNYQIAEGVGPNCSECGASLPKSLLTSRSASPREAE